MTYKSKYGEKNLFQYRFGSDGGATGAYSLGERYLFRVADSCFVGTVDAVSPQEILLVDYYVFPKEKHARFVHGSETEKYDWISFVYLIDADISLCKAVPFIILIRSNVLCAYPCAGIEVAGRLAFTGEVDVWTELPVGDKQRRDW